ncbi:MAG TPA: TadE/TadG family type IV pilus assembly protein [Armatimonadota bacterium]|nr:TadE/TadG family type IV pilus assembly protein [Armatimonadota bacterium]
MNRLKQNQGATMVEFAISLGVLLLMLLAVAEFGAIYKDLMVLNQAAREGVRMAAVGATSDTVTGEVRSAASTLNAAQITVTTAYSGDDGTTFALTPGVVNSRNNIPSEALIRVHAEYPHRLLTSLVLPGKTEVTLRCDMIMQRQ